MNAVIILSGGTGSRVGDSVPKQYIRVWDKMVIGWCLEKFVLKEISGIFGALVIVAHREWRSDIELCFSDSSSGMKGVEFENTDFKDHAGTVFKGFADPGETRQLSIYNGLIALKDICGDDDLVMIHDAARPMIRSSFIKKCFEAADGHDGVMPVLPMKDTVYLSHNGKKVDSLLDRSEIYAGQAPEVFRYKKYLLANEALLPNDILGIKGSTEPAVKAGMDIVMISGDEGNYKITTREDLKKFEREIGLNP